VSGWVYVCMYVYACVRDRFSPLQAGSAVLWPSITAADFGRSDQHIHASMYVCICMCVCVYIYIYIYIDR